MIFQLVINKTKITALLATILINSAVMAGGLSDGNWEFEEGLEVVGHADYDNALVFSIYHTSLDNLDQIKGEIDSIADMNDVYYSDMDDQLMSAYGEVENDIKKDYTGFNSSQLSYFNREKYIESEMPSGLVMFNLRLNKPVVYRSFRSFRNFEDLRSIVINAKFFETPDNYPVKTLQRERFNSSQLNAIISAFKSAYNVDITNPSVSFLYSEASGEMIAQTNQNNSSSNILLINLKTGKALMPFKLVRFQY